MTNISHNCDQIIPILDSYFDGESSPAENALVEEHLSGCPECKNRLTEIGHLVAVFKSLPEERPDLDFVDRIESAIAKGEVKVIPPKVFNFSQTTWLSAVAAVAFLAVLASLFLSDFSASKTNVRIANRPKLDGFSLSKISAVSSDGQQSLPQVAKSVNNNTSKQSAVGATRPTAASSLVSTNNESKVEDIGSKPDLVAFSELEQNNVSEEIGITTDEDGLYAIKL